MYRYTVQTVLTLFSENKACVPMGLSRSQRDKQMPILERASQWEVGQLNV